MSDFDPSAIRSQRLQRFFDYWSDKRRAESLPGRADIDPLAFVWALGYVSLYDVLPDGDFRIRLDGSRVAEFFGADLTGRNASQHPQGEMADLIRGTLRRVAALRLPLVQQREIQMQARYWRYESLTLPLADDGLQVDSLVCVFDFEGR